MRCAKHLAALVLAKSGRIPIGIRSIIASGQSARAWCRSPVRITHLGLKAETEVRALKRTVAQSLVQVAIET